jgi:hypothetical protein
VDGLGHLPLVYSVPVPLGEHHQTLEAHYQNHRPVLEQDLLLELVLVEPTFVV